MSRQSHGRTSMNGSTSTREKPYRVLRHTVYKLYQLSRFDCTLKSCCHHHVCSSYASFQFLRPTHIFLSAQLPRTAIMFCLGQPTCGQAMVHDVIGFRDFFPCSTRSGCQSASKRGAWRILTHTSTKWSSVAAMAACCCSTLCPALFFIRSRVSTRPQPAASKAPPRWMWSASDSLMGPHPGCPLPTCCACVCNMTFTRHVST